MESLAHVAPSAHWTSGEGQARVLPHSEAEFLQVPSLHLTVPVQMLPSLIVHSSARITQVDVFGHLNMLFGQLHCDMLSTHVLSQHLSGVDPLQI